MRALRTLFGRRSPPDPAAAAVPAPVEAPAAPDAPARLELAIAPNDPLLAYLQQSGTVADVSSLRLDSPALTKLREAGVKLVVPLVSQGELLGLISLGPRRSDQEYSSDDRRLLADLASRAAPSVRVAQLVRQQQIETRERERIESELRVARIIQETLLPKELPDLPGYAIAAYWQPARAVGGDFYDFIQFEDGSLALIVGDVTDKGVPAALVMSTTRTVLRATAERLRTPGTVLARANNILCPDIPAKMFVTCLYALLDPASGVLRYANAGHDLPYLRTHATADSAADGAADSAAGEGAGEGEGAIEMRATGMPLGLLPDMHYEEKVVTLQPGDTVVFYSDGLVEAHNAQREMFSFARLRRLVGRHQGGASMIPFLLDELARFAGPDWEQEDDVTLVTLQRTTPTAAGVAGAPGSVEAPDERHSTNGEIDSALLPGAPALPAAAETTLLAEFTVSSVAGNEREAVRRVAKAVEFSGLSPSQSSRLKTAVAEAVMNAMEHGNQYNPQLSVALQVLARPDALLVRITDHGGGRPVPAPTEPNLDAKLAGLQSPRGWGLFLIRNMVDEVRTETDEIQHTVELTMRRSSALPAQPRE